MRSTLRADLFSLGENNTWLMLGLLEAPVSTTHVACAGASCEERTKGNCPGNGMDIPKFMDLLNAAWDRCRFGASAGTS